MPSFGTRARFPSAVHDDDDDLNDRSERGCLCITTVYISQTCTVYAIATPFNSPPSPCTLTQLVPDLTRADNDPLLDALDAVQGRSDVQCKYGLAVRCMWSRVVVDHVPYFFTCTWPPNDPVVTVKRRLGAVTPRQIVCAHDGAETYLNREGNSHPANIQNLAFGDISPGRPLNLARCGCSSSGLTVILSVGLPGNGETCSYCATRFSHFSTSPQARSFKKL